MSNALKLLGLVILAIILALFGFGAGLLGVIAGYYAKTRRKSILWAATIAGGLAILFSLILVSFGTILPNLIGALALTLLTYHLVGSKRR